MTVSPIVERELRVAARQRAAYWGRSGVALVAILVVSVAFVFTYDQAPTQTGRFIFEWLSGLLLLYCLAYGRRATADCLSQEKREGTLGLLFLTDLKGFDVVLGKLVATSVRGFYGLVAVFPVLAVPLLLGGITNGEFWRMVLVLVDTFLFSLAIGILGSALSRDLRGAMAANLCLLLALMAAPAASMGALAYFTSGVRSIPQLLYSCPVFAFYLCDDAHYGMAQHDFWWSVAVIHGLTWLLLFMAGWILPRSWQDRPAQAQKSTWRDRWRAWSYGPVAGSSAFRKRTLDISAFYWLAARARFKAVHVWAFLACMAAWWITFWRISGGFWLEPPAAVLTALMLNFTLKVWLTIEAGQQLADDQRSGAFELLLTSPLTVSEILRGQLLALRRQFLRPLLVVLVVEVLLTMAVHQRAPDSQTLAMWLAGMFMLVADLVALSWVGMWRALVARSHNHATINTLFYVLFLPWALFGLIVAVGNLWCELWLSKEWSPDWRLLLALWMGLGLAADLFYGLKARRQLRTRFRELALRRFNPLPSRFARWFGQGATGRSRVQKPEVAAVSAKPDQPQSRDEHREGRELRTPAPVSSRLRRAVLFVPLHFGVSAVNPRVKLALSGCLLLVIIGLGFIFLRSRSYLPPPLVVPLSQTNGPFRVFPGSGGVLMILPDGSLWRWGKAGKGSAPGALVPEQVGTNCDWSQAVTDFNHSVGLRRDGTLWEWGDRGMNPTTQATLTTEPQPVQFGEAKHTWVSIAGSALHSVALRSDGTLWAWGDNSVGQLGVGPDPNHSRPVQVGTNSDWTAICCPGISTLALRRDGTLWAWGRIYLSGSGVMAMNNLPVPTRLCLESNWTGFFGESFPLVLNRLGELWEPFRAPPNPEVSAASNFRLVVTNAVLGRFAVAWCAGPRIYEVRSNGTLWERTQPLSAYAAAPVGDWHRLGKRSDWTTLWGEGGTALGLTADGTLWTWGIDPSREPVLNFLSRLQVMRTRLITFFGSGPKPMFGGGSPPYQKQPRPLMRLVLTNSAPPAKAGNATGR